MTDKANEDHCAVPATQAEEKDTKQVREVQVFGGFGSGSQYE